MVNGKIDMTSHRSEHQITECKYEVGKKEDKSGSQGKLEASNDRTEEGIEEKSQNTLKEFALSSLSGIGKGFSKGVGLAKNVLHNIWNDPQPSEGQKEAIVNTSESPENAISLAGNPAVRVEEKIPGTDKGEKEENAVTKVEKPDLNANMDLHLGRQRKETETFAGKRARTVGLGRHMAKTRTENHRNQDGKLEKTQEGTNYLLDSYNKTGEYSILGKESYRWKENEERPKSYSRKV